jgi:hypothetical protein
MNIHPARYEVALPPIYAFHTPFTGELARLSPCPFSETASSFSQHMFKILAVGAPDWEELVWLPRMATALSFIRITSSLDLRR